MGSFFGKGALSDSGLFLGIVLSDEDVIPTKVVAGSVAGIWLSITVSYRIYHHLDRSEEE